jgi:hypothetical protein
MSQDRVEALVSQYLDEVFKGMMFSQLNISFALAW